MGARLNVDRHRFGQRDLHAITYLYFVEILGVLYVHRHLLAFGPLEHRFLVRPGEAFRQGMRVDPYRAGAGEAWRVRRAITLKSGGSCDALPGIVDSGFCEDTFEVKSIQHGR